MPKLKIINLVARATEKVCGMGQGYGATVWKMAFSCFSFCCWLKHWDTAHTSVAIYNTTEDFLGRWPHGKVLNFKLRKWEMYKRISMNYYYYCHYIRLTVWSTCPMESSAKLFYVGHFALLKLPLKIIKSIADCLSAKRRGSRLINAKRHSAPFNAIYWLYRFWMISKRASPFVAYLQTNGTIR